MSNTDYSRMSDFEINKRVGDVIKLEWADLDENYSNLCYWKDGSLLVFNPCNNPADAWDIIYNNNITVSAPMITDEPSYWLCYDTNNSDISFNDKNSLRAAMIVFLKMQDSKNVSERMLNNLEKTLKTENFDTYE